MSEQKLYVRYSYRQLLDEVDVVEYFSYQNRSGHWGEITEKQGDILHAFLSSAVDRSMAEKIQKKRASQQKP